MTPFSVLAIYKCFGLNFHLHPDIAEDYGVVTSQMIVIFKATGMRIYKSQTAGSQN
jgi:hypothetical protein